MIHTVIWDWNGTLLDDLEVSFSAINRVLTSNGYPPIRDLLPTGRCSAFR